MSDEYLTIHEVAERLRVSVPTLQGWRRAGLLRGFVAGRVVRFHRAEVDRFIEAHTTPARPRELAEVMRP